MSPFLALVSLLLALAAPQSVVTAPAQQEVGPEAAATRSDGIGARLLRRMMTDVLADDLTPVLRESGDGFTRCQKGGLCELSGCR